MEKCVKKLAQLSPRFGTVQLRGVHLVITKNVEMLMQTDAVAKEVDGSSRHYVLNK